MAQKLVNEPKVVDIKSTNKKHREIVSPVETHAINVVTGKVTCPETERRLCVKYLLELDLLRKKQRMMSRAVRLKRKMKLDAKPEDVAQESAQAEITPELAKRLAGLEGK